MVAFRRGVVRRRRCVRGPRPGCNICTTSLPSIRLFLVGDADPTGAPHAQHAPVMARRVE